MPRSNYSPAVGLLAFSFLLTGCTSSFLNHDDEIRRENLELKDKIAELQHSIDLRVAQIDSMHSATTRPTKIEGSEILRAVKVEFGSYSGPRDSKHDGMQDQLVLYVETLDQRGRFIPVSGQATVQIVDIHPGVPPKVIVERTVGAKEWDLDYRVNFTGTHYLLEIPLPPNLPADLKEVTAKIAILDAGTGATLTTEQSFELRPAAAK